MKKEIYVRAHSKISVTPDIMIYKIQLDTSDADYSTAILTSEKNVSEFYNIMKSIGVEKETIKTKSFGIIPEYEMKIEDTLCEDVLTGYCVRYVFTITMDIDPLKIGKIVSALSKCSCAPILSTAMAIKNVSEIREKLVLKLSEDAKKDATLLCSNVGSELGELISVDYEIPMDFDFVDGFNTERRNYRGIAHRSMMSDIDINPEKKDFEASASYTWAIK